MVDVLQLQGSLPGIVRNWEMVASFGNFPYRNLGAKIPTALRYVPYPYTREMIEAGFCHWISHGMFMHQDSIVNFPCCLLHVLM